MTDSVQAQLEAVLRGIEERVGHLPTCGSLAGRYDAEGMYIDHVCDCDRPARVRAEQARAVERMLPAVAAYVKGDEILDGGFWAAALRAGEEHQ